MESLSEPAETVTIPLVIPVPDYLRDHAIGGLAVLPAVEALQIVARSRAAGLDRDSCRQELAVFHHPLLIDPGAKEIFAVHEHERYADGRCLSRMMTIRTGRQMKFTRPMEHLSVWFTPAGIQPFQRISPLRPEEEMPFGGVSPQPHDTLFPAPEDLSSHSGPLFRVPVERLYDELVPFGPAYRNLRGEVWLTETSISGTVSGGLFPDAEGPLGSPFPLDAAMHAACAWGQRYRNRVVFPVGFDRREIFSPTRSGELYLCRITPPRDEGAVLCFDVHLQDRQGRPVEAIRGLQMRDIFAGRRIPPAWVREGIPVCT